MSAEKPCYTASKSEMHIRSSGQNYQRSEPSRSDQASLPARLLGMTTSLSAALGIHTSTRDKFRVAFRSGFVRVSLEGQGRSSSHSEPEKAASYSVHLRFDLWIDEVAACLFLRIRRNVFQYVCTEFAARRVLLRFRRTLWKKLWSTWIGRRLSVSTGALSVISQYLDNVPVSSLKCRLQMAQE